MKAFVVIFYETETAVELEKLKIFENTLGSIDGLCPIQLPLKDDAREY